MTREQADLKRRGADSPCDVGRVRDNLQNNYDPFPEVQRDGDRRIIRSKRGVVDCSPLRPTDDEWRGRKKLRPVFLNKESSGSTKRHDEVELSFPEKICQIIDDWALVVWLLKSRPFERGFVQINLVRQFLEQFLAKLSRKEKPG